MAPRSATMPAGSTGTFPKANTFFAVQSRDNRYKDASCLCKVGMMGVISVVRPNCAMNRQVKSIQEQPKVADMNLY
jgi:hypothetical protein